VASRLWPPFEPEQFLRGLAFGPGGDYLSVDPSTNTIYRVVGELGLVEPLVSVDIEDPIVELMRVGPRPTIDCTTLETGAADVIKINDSCAPPIAAFEVAPQLECESPGGATVLLDGSSSIDVNQPEGRFDGDTFRWFVDFGEPTQQLVAEGQVVAALLPLGENRVTLELTNAYGEVDLTDRVVTVVDTVPPELEVFTTPQVLTPATGKLTDVITRVQLRDTCAEGALTSWVLQSVTSNEATGAEPDILGVSPGTADTAVQLRASFDPDGNGRVYTLTYLGEDPAGNATSVSTEVRVPRPPRVGSPIDTIEVTSDPRELRPR
jgi:hypothetical protein